MILAKGINKVMHKPHLLSFICTDVPSCQHHVKGTG